MLEVLICYLLLSFFVVGFRFLWPSFFTHGSYQKITGKNVFAGISQSSVSRCIAEVTAALTNPHIFNDWVKFPENIRELQSLRTR